MANWLTRRMPSACFVQALLIAGLVQHDAITRKSIERHLFQARSHVALGEIQIAKRRRVIERYEEPRLDATEARRLLVNFHNLQEQHLDGVARLKKELAAADAK